MTQPWQQTPQESGTTTPRSAEKASISNQEDIQDDWKPSRHEVLVIITLAVTNLLVALDASIITTSLNAIVTGLQGNTTQAFWVGTSYLLVNAVVMPVMASMSDIFGRPICLTISLVLFTVGTVLCCAANTIGVLLVGRCIQGVGGGGIHVLGGVIMTDIVPLRHRPKWFGIVLGAWALGLCLGPILGGVVAEKTTWRWVFYMMFPICAYGLIAVPILLTLKPRTESLKAKLMRVDWLGTVLFMGSATSFLIAITWGGVQQPWNSAATLTPLIVGVVGLAATLVWEGYFAAEPLFKRSLFCNASSVVSYICAAIQGMLMWGLLYYLPFYFQTLKAFSPISTGLSTLPSLVTVTVGAVITGRLVTRLQSYVGFVQVGWLIAAVACALTVTWRFTSVTTAMWVITYLLIGLGHGMVLNAGNFATQAMCRPGDEASAAATYLFLRQLGAAVGVGVGGSAFQNVMAARLEQDGLPRAIAENAEAYVEELRRLPEGADLKARVLAAYDVGFGGVFALYLAVAGVALVLSLLFVRHFPLDKELSSEHRLEATKVTRIFDGTSGSGGSVSVSAGTSTSTVVVTSRPHSSSSERMV
ncbi:putative efflux pump antibiotic resistance protein [Eutypa lata UCREL1]|uniref:Putative efflux pump antibiotic resistance protein n=1 Tax=Eutypa lata (strain UCR-EL1) TaxID=1287681 RepID=M7TRD2_EUTLA|nr:putative efflux pump antibiotic resistance protein [Eutypa lata UCREL1]